MPLRREEALWSLRSLRVKQLRVLCALRVRYLLRPPVTPVAPRLRVAARPPRP